MEKFTYTNANKPTYLKESYGIDIDASGAFNIGKILNDDFCFVDSKLDIGVQVSDLLASGLRRLLRGEFENQDLVSELIGKLMVSNFKNQPSINLISFTDSEVNSAITGKAINNIDKFSKAMVIN